MASTESLETCALTSSKQETESQGTVESLTGAECMSGVQSENLLQMNAEQPSRPECVSHVQPENLQQMNADQPSRAGAECVSRVQPENLQQMKADQPSRAGAECVSRVQPEKLQQVDAEQPSQASAECISRVQPENLQQMDTEQPSRAGAECMSQVQPESLQQVGAEQPSRVAAEREYEAQYLGFCPQSFCDGMYNAVSDYTWQHFQAAQDYMKSEFSSVIKEEELHQGSQIFLSKINKYFDKAFDKAETYLLTNILYVPPEVVLPEDQIQEDFRDFSKQEDQLLDADIQNLKNRIKALKYMNASLRQELAQEDVVKVEYKQYLEQLTAIERTLREAGVSDPRESLMFVVGKSNKIAKIIRRMQGSNVANKRPLPEGDELEARANKIKDLGGLGAGLQ